MKSLFICIALLLFLQEARGALSSAIQWEIRSVGSPNNGGGFKLGASGTDYSQQTSPQYALTSIATAGTGATFLTASAAANMVGNVAHVVSGTNFTTGFFEIISVSVGVSVTCDANVCTGVGASGVINIGGALDVPGTIGTNSANQGAVAGNTIWIKADGTYSRTTNTDTMSTSGTLILPIVISGYKTTRGDGYLGRTTNNLDLISTNMPALSYSTGNLTVNGEYTITQILNVSQSGNSTSGAITFSGNGDSLLRSCIATTASTSAGTKAIAINGGRCTILDCDASCTGSISSPSSAIIDTQSQGSPCIDSCRIRGTNSTIPGINASSTCVVYGNIVYASGGIALKLTDTSLPAFVRNNTFVGCTADGISITGHLSPHRIFGNMITDNGGYGITCSTTTNASIIAYNRTRDNTSGAIGPNINWATQTSWGEVTTDTGGDTTDYVSPGSSAYNYNLISTSPATSAGLPYAGSMGAFQRLQTSSGSTGGSFTFSQ